MAADSIRLMCPNLRCKTILVVPLKARGKSVQCRKCGMRIKIPGGASGSSGPSGSKAATAE